MFSSLQSRINRFRQRLTKLDDQPLSRAALAVILFLDFFILSAIFDGLADHTRQLTSPQEQIPQLCQDIVIDGDWNPSNRLSNLAQLVSIYQSQRFLPFEERKTAQTHPVCGPIINAYDTVRDDASLARDLMQTLSLNREIRDLRADMDRMKGAYDTQLLENIAGHTKSDSDTSAIRQNMTDKTAALNERVGRQAEIEARLAQSPKISQLFQLVDRISEADRTALRDELRSLNFWYPAKRLGMEMVFLLPLLGVFYFWNTRSLARGKPFQTLVSSHLLVVVCIPVVLKVMELVYDIIPRRFLRQIIELLESLKLVAIWHYLLIAVSILAALALIYLFQKKLFSQERLVQRRIAKGQCQACGFQLPANSQHCPACGSPQYRTCSHCGQSTHLHGRYCIACGGENPE